MDDDEKNPDDKMLGMIWLIGVTVAIIVFISTGHSVSALFVAIAGGVGHPASRDALHRYGVGESRRAQVVVGAGVLAFVTCFAAPGADNDGRVADAPQDAETDAPQQENIDEPQHTDGEALDAAAAPLPEIVGCSAIDGDTLNCGGERIRLLGIDAPEMDGHCLPGRVCVPGDGEASRSYLVGALQYSMSIERVGQDQYGRTLAIVLAGGENLSCIQLSAGQAVYKAEWDDGRRVANWCPAVAS